MWTIIASVSRLPDYGGQPWAAFSLNTILTEEGDVTPPKELLLPWKCTDGSFFVLTATDTGSIVRITDTVQAHKFEPETDTVPHWKLLTEALEAQDHTLTKVSPTNMELEPVEETWSGKLASLSQYGWPLAHYLRLAAWVQLEKHKENLKEKTWLGLVPSALRVEEGDKMVEWVPDLTDVRPKDGKVFITYKNDGIPKAKLSLRLASLKEDDDSAKLLEAPFLESPELPKAHERNWRSGFLTAASAFMDLLPWWQTQEPQPHQARLLMKEALCLIHDHAGPGLQMPLDHDPMDESLPVARDILRAIIPDTSKVEVLLKLKAPVPTIEVWQKELKEALADSGRGSQYPLLAVWLKLLPELDKLSDGDSSNWLDDKSIVPRITAGKIEVTKEGFQQAVEELRMAALDEEILASLFIGEWYRLAGDKLFTMATRPGESRPDRATLAIRLTRTLADTGRGLAARLGDALARRWAAAAIAHTSYANDPQPGAEAEATAALKKMLEAWRDETWASNDKNAKWLRPKEPLVRLPDEALDSLFSDGGAFRPALLKLTGDAKAPLSVAEPHPLLVPIPALKEEQLHDISGLLIFSRRVTPQKTDQHWQCLTVGELRLRLHADEFPDDEGFLLASQCLVPWQVSETNGVVPQMIEYRGRPLGVEMLETAASATSIQRTGGVPEDQSAIQLFYAQLQQKSNEGWGLVTGLCYRDSDTMYEFLFSPVHNTGALPEKLVRGTKPGILLKTDEFLKIARDAHPKKGPYQRRVGIGAPRLIAPLSSADPKDSRAFRSAVPPPGVKPMAVDLRNGLPDGTGNKPQESPDFTVVLLHKVQSQASFALRPPATSFENWRLWQRGSGWNAAPMQSLEGDAQYAIGQHADRWDERQRSASRSAPAEMDPEHPAQIVDDPTVGGVLIRLTRLFSRHGTQAPPCPPFFIPVLPRHTPNDWPTEPTPDKVNQVFDWLRHPCSFLGGGFCEVKVWRSPGKVLTLPKEGKKIAELGIPDGEVWDMTIASCIAASERNRFDILTNGEVTVFKAGGKDWLEINKARVFWRIETTPEAPSLGYLPAPDEIWRSLKLRARERKGRLEVALDPALQAQSAWRWAYASGVELHLQPWRWNGTPQEGKDLLSAAKEGADEDEGVRQQLIRAEPPAYGDRADNDAMLIESFVNFAPWASGYVKVPVTGSPCPILEEPGPRDPAPRYYRARVKIFSRYRGLTEHQTPAAGQISWIVAGGEWTTPWRRQLIRGSLASPPGPPRVKLVIPLLEGSAGSRPGFLALCRETLESPFHQLRASIAVAETIEVHPTTGELTETRCPEVAPDPITSRDPLYVASPSEKLHLSPGRAAGLTFEREAASPLFPHTAFQFDLPGGLADLDRAKGHDLFLKVRFQWLIPGAALGDPSGADDCPDITSPETLPWQVRVLAPFDTVRFRAHDDTGTGTVHLASEMRFNLDSEVNPNHEVLQFWHKDNPSRRGRILPPEMPGIKQDGARENLDRGVLPELLFVGSAMVPDLLSTESGSLVVSLHYLPHNNASVTILPLGPGVPKPTQGHIIMLHSSRDAIGPPQDTKALIARLFGDQEGETDAASMIVRISAAIPRGDARP
jgi:hypothetical protein